MDKDTAIHALRLHNEWRKGNHDVMLNPTLLTEVLDFIISDDFEDQSKPKWIPVAERLPGNLDSVIVCLESKHVHKLTYGESNGFFEPLSNKYASDKNPVTHWMPLPEPPKQS